MKDPDDKATIDAFAPPAAPKPFIDTRNQRAKVAQEKAELCLTLKALVDKPPPGVVNGGITATRAWMGAAKDCRKVLAKMSSTVPQLTAAISRMQAFK